MYKPRSRRYQAKVLHLEAKDEALNRFLTGILLQQQRLMGHLAAAQFAMQQAMEREQWLPPEPERLVTMH